MVGDALSWSGLRPTFEWRSSQRHLLELASHVEDRRWHLCAPPGAGKTFIGLELARQVGAPTLVLAPTVAIRDQWRASTARFGADPAAFTSSDPATPAPLLAVTYQLLGNPGDAAAELRAAARRLWVAEVGAAAGLDDDEAERRVATTERADPDRARRERLRHVRALRRTLTQGDELGLSRATLLGARPLALVERLAAAKIGCVVLDECHHLLDWWALVVGALVERLEQERPVAVVGLTATLPDPDSSREAENYRGLLGDVDAELQLAAMVAEGTVAPWRDGIRIARVTDGEQAFLDGWADRFAADLDDELAGEPFVAWAVAQVTDPALDIHLADPSGVADDHTDLDQVGDPDRWDDFWDRDPLTAAGVARWWATRGMALPAGFDPPPLADPAGALTLADRLRLLHAWLHDPDAEVAETSRSAVATVTNRHGVALTTAGPRWLRSAADVVCAFSSAKGPAAAAILAEEGRRRGDRMRALVAVERDRATTPSAAVREVLGEDAGTAARVLAALCAAPEVVERGVLLVTGRGAWADAVGADRIAAAVNVAAGVTDGGRWVEVEGCDIRGAVRLAGRGGPWSSARWLAAAEAALDDGAAQVLVATRGLVGEGWDHPPLDVLVDLTDVASSSATTQLRGRAIRVDPADPAKLASLWDVVVAHPAAPGDWQRVRRRHARWWGPGPDGAVATGPAKLDPRVAHPEPPPAEEADRINAASAAAVADVTATRAAWAAVDPGGVAAAAVHVRRPRPRRRRVRTRSTGWRWQAAGAAASAVVAAGGVTMAVATPAVWALVAVAGVVAGVCGRAARGVRRDEPATLAAVAEGVSAGLVAAGHAELVDARVVVGPDPAGGWFALADGVSDDAAEAWADAVAEALGPLGTPRWLVDLGPGNGDGDRAWRVPTAVGTTRVAAEAFVRAVRRRVPGATLVRAGTPRATELVLAAHAPGADHGIDRSLRWR
jgi:hypothetical protein